MKEQAFIETVPNPNFRSTSTVNKMITRVRFVGLTGKSKRYVDGANSAYCWTLFFIAQKMIANGSTFEEAANEVIAYENKKVRERRGATHVR